jgi:ubiquinone/menaquinone biosynthesis C-methylase UbiE
MTFKLRRYWYAFLKDQDIRLGGWACHAMRLRGFSSRPVHPKHLFDEERTDYLQELLLPGLSFLDIGSGVGTECILAAKSGARISCGLEYNQQSLLTAVQRAKQQGGHTTFLRVDLEAGKLPFRDDCFDLINFTNVLEHLQHRREILREIKRVKRTEGIVVLSVPNAMTTWKEKLQSAGLDPRDDDDHKIEYTKETLEAELSQAGLQRVSAFQPIIPSFPWNGIIAMSAFFSPKLYLKLQRKKKEYVKTRPEESTGWIMSVK